MTETTDGRLCSSRRRTWSCKNGDKASLELAAQGLRDDVERLGNGTGKSGALSQQANYSSVVLLSAPGTDKRKCFQGCEML